MGNQLKFTDRFLEVPSSVVDKKQKEMLGEDNADKSFVKCMINPFEISDYREDIDDDETNVVVVSFKNGTEIMVHLTIQEFEKRLNAF